MLMLRGMSIFFVLKSSVISKNYTRKFAYKMIFLLNDKFGLNFMTGKPFFFIILYS